MISPRIQEIIEQIVSAPLSSYTLEVFKPPKSAKPSDRWSALNRLTMFLGGTSDARGFRQWQEAGRHVKKGARAIYILGPVLKRMKVIEVDEDGNEQIVEIHKLLGFKAIPVFRVEDTEGDPLPEDDLKPEIPAEFEGIIKELGLTVSAAPFEGEYYGIYERLGNMKRIELMTPDVLTFLHELCHAVDDKLNQLKGNKEEKEFVAELGSALVGSLLGYEPKYSNVKSYLAMYGYTDPREEITLLNRTLEVVQWIVERTAKEEIEVLA